MAAKYIMRRNSIKTIQRLKNKRPISCLTAYTSSIAKIVDQNVDVILVGDSLGTVIYGFQNTRSVTLEMMKNHGRAVMQSSHKSFTIIDMPYKTYVNKKKALVNAKHLLQFTNCQSVKLETDKTTVPIVSHLVKNKILVVSHIGALPQHFKDFSKIRLIGKTTKQKKDMLGLAHQLEEAGSSLLVLECIERELAKEITESISIPTIGIGSSINCDGQILVINDILNTDDTFKKPQFVKTYANFSYYLNKAVKRYDTEVKNKKFPKK